MNDHHSLQYSQLEEGTMGVKTSKRKRKSGNKIGMEGGGGGKKVCEVAG